MKIKHINLMIALVVGLGVINSSYALIGSIRETPETYFTRALEENDPRGLRWILVDVHTTVQATRELLKQELANPRSRCSIALKAYKMRSDTHGQMFEYLRQYLGIEK